MEADGLLEVSFPDTLMSPHQQYEQLQHVYCVNYCVIHSSALNVELFSSTSVSAICPTTPRIISPFHWNRRTVCISSQEGGIGAHVVSRALLRPAQSDQQTARMSESYRGRSEETVKVEALSVKSGTQISYLASLPDLMSQPYIV